jgi:predicted PurR-regulated permease PerM
MLSTRTVVGFALLVAAGVVVYLLSPILTPFLVGALIAYICNPIVRRLQGWRVPRVLAVILVFGLIVGLFAALFLFLLPRIEQAVAGFFQRLPAYLEALQLSLIPYLRDRWGVELTLDIEALRSAATAHWRDIGDALGKTLAYVTQSGFGLVTTLVNLVLIPVVTFYLLLDWEQVLEGAQRLLPPSKRASVRRLATETDGVLASFLRGQLSVMAALAAVYSTGLMLVGLDLALPIGMVAGLVSFVPYLGFITGITAAGIAAYLQFPDPVMLAWVAVVFGVGQALEGMVLTPRLVGSRIGLHPVAVIFAIMAGGQLFGFIGVLLALPTAAVLKVWLSHLHEYYVSPETARPRPRPARRK